MEIIGILCYQPTLAKLSMKNEEALIEINNELVERVLTTSMLKENTSRDQQKKIL